MACKLFFKINLLVLYLIVLGLHCYVDFSLVAVSRAYCLAVVSRLLIAVSSLVVEHGCVSLSSCGSWAQ